MAEPALPSLDTPRAMLVPATPDDVGSLHALFTDPVVRRFLWDDEIITRDQVAETIVAAARQNAEGRGLWTIRGLRRPRRERRAAPPLHSDRLPRPSSR